MFRTWINDIQIINDVNMVKFCLRNCLTSFFQICYYVLKYRGSLLCFVLRSKDVIANTLTEKEVGLDLVVRNNNKLNYIASNILRM